MSKTRARLAALGGLILTPFGLLLGGPAIANAAGGSCAVVVPGTTETNANAPTNVVPGLLAGYGKQLQQGGTSVYSVPYAAQLAPTTGQVELKDSMAQGRQRTIAAVQSAAQRCSRVSVIGFSQGAGIADDVAKGIGTGQIPIEGGAGKIGDIQLFGNPFRGAAGNLPGGGIFGATTDYGALNQNVQNYCAVGDPICRTQQGALAAGLGGTQGGGATSGGAQWSGSDKWPQFFADAAAGWLGWSQHPGGYTVASPAFGGKTAVDAAAQKVTTGAKTAGEGISGVGVAGVQPGVGGGAGQQVQSVAAASSILQSIVGGGGGGGQAGLSPFSSTLRSAPDTGVAAPGPMPGGAPVLPQADQGTTPPAQTGQAPTAPAATVPPAAGQALGAGISRAFGLR